MYKLELSGPPKADYSLLSPQGKIKGFDMLCENCKKKEANIHYTEIYNNKTREMHYCSVCAEKKRNCKH